MSRYLQQLIYELKKPIERNVLHTPVKPNSIKPIIIAKDERVFNKLATYCNGKRLPKPMSPTAINDYIECSLRFYFKYVAGIKEPREIQEDLDARVLGNLLHEVMQLFYEQITQTNKNNIIEVKDLKNWEGRIDPIIDQVFRKSYDIKTKKIEYYGQRLVVKEVIKSFVGRIVSMDRDYAPFKIEAIEADELKVVIRLNVEGNPEVVLGGKVDRVDSKDGVLRVIDYKTGKDNVEIKGTVNDLFSHEANRNKAAFQTMMYSLLYTENADISGLRVLPGLMNRMNLFDENFRFGLKVGKEYVEDIRSLLQEFRQGLKGTLEEMFNAEQPFDQTENTEYCKNCPYKGICYRQARN
jgi:CRISPR/Cas system-associated exonuclease Cas4 (RecB family)